MAYQGSRFTSSLLPAVGAGASLFAIRVSSPAVVFLATLSLLSIKPLSPPPPSPVTPVVVESRVPRRTLILVLLSLSSLSFLIDGLAYVAGAVFNKAWTLGTGIPLASLLGLVAYAGLAALGAWKDINNIQVWSFNRVRLAITFALALDIAQVVLLAPSVKTRGSAHLCDNTKLSKCIPDTFHLLTPFIRVLILIPLLFSLYSPRTIYTHVETQPEAQANSNESAPLQEDGPAGESSKYGTFTTQGQCDSGPPPTCPDAKEAPPKHESSCTTLRRLRTYLYSTFSRRCKFLAAFTGLLHIITRILKPLLPLSLGAAVNAFISHSSAGSYPIPMPFGTSPYPYIFTFVILFLLTSRDGIPAMVFALGSRIGEQADSVLESAYVSLLLGLSLGDGASVKNKASLYPTGAVSRALEALLIVKAVVLDAVIGIVVLGLLFGWEVALGVFVFLAIYIYASCVLTRILSPSMVSYASSHASLAFVLLTLVQAIIASGGLLLGSLYIARGVVDSVWSVGAWVAWVWYWCALILPFSSTPCLYRTLEDVRTVLDVLARPAGIIDFGNGSLDGDGGVEIRFENVSFTYPYSAEHTQSYGALLSSVSFTVPASATVALVGVPGSGKSTILKLLYRLYTPDVNGGSIYLDGKNVRDISLCGIRDKLAVVAKVGEDERRAAVSRALAKDARVVLVEGDLDADVLQLINSPRTVLWEVDSAHFASVQEGVDQILVLKDGQIAEQGTFKELLEADGVFATMWAEHNQQVSAATGPDPSTTGYDVEVVDAEAISGSAVIAESPRAATASLPPAASVRAPTASIHAESVAPSVPTKDNNDPISFPISDAEVEHTPPAPVTFPTSDDDKTTQAPAPVSFPTSDDANSVSSHPRPAIPGHIHGASVTFDTTTTPPRASTPDPTGSPKSEPTDGKRKRISSQNFQRIARRISLSTPRKGTGIPGIANIANVLKRDTSLKGESKDKGGEAKSGETGAQDADVVSATGSGGNSARNSGELSRQSDKDKEREEKKKRRRSFMQIGSS